MKKKIIIKNRILLLGITTACAALCSCSEQSIQQDQANQPKLSQDDFGSIKLQTSIPEAVPIGTPPPPLKIKNLELAPKNAPTLTVPAGVELISAGKPVSSSDDFPIIGELSYITDGEKNGGEGYFVELLDGPQWVQIDLEHEAQLFGIWIWHYNGWPRAYHDVIVQLSNDPEFQTGVTTIFNNDSDKSAGLGKGRDNPYVESAFGKLLDAKGIRARFVRLYSNGNTVNDMNQYIEVEVYGKHL
ncbi:MAG: hypothetical protein AAF571_03895 [Verrucomicrobiota bacterium]